MTLQEVTDAIESSSLDKKPILIGIEGYGGSGKTTFANKLCDNLSNAWVVNIDDFIVKEKVSEPSWDKGGFDRDRLESEVLLPASNGMPIQYRELLWATNELSAPNVVPDVDYLIIEGISCYHPNLSHYYDYKIWIDTPIDVAKSRGKARDAGNENVDKWDIWAQNDLDYQSVYHPELQADFIVSGI